MLGRQKQQLKFTNINVLQAWEQKIISATEGMELSCKEKELKDLLLTVATQDIEQKEDGSVTIKRGVAKDRVISTTDPEMPTEESLTPGSLTATRAIPPWIKKVNLSPPLP